MVYVSGYSPGRGSDNDYLTVAYDAATGAKVWTARYNGRGREGDTPYGLDVSPDGSKVFVTGISWDGGSRNDYLTVAYDAATGARVWVSRYNGPDKDDFASGLAVSPDASTVFVTGYSEARHTLYDYATVAYDAATGAEVWSTRYHGFSNDYARAVAVSPDGSTIFVTGESWGDLVDYVTVAYDAATGAELWVVKYNGGGSYPTDEPTSLGVSPDGSSVFVTGDSVGDETADYATVAYDADTGTELWVSRYDGPRSSADSASSLGVSPDGGTVFVTGSSYGEFATFDDFATVAYDAATGTELWVTRYDGPRSGNDVASALGVSPDGAMVFVTGYSAHRQGPADFATLAYDAATGMELWMSRAGGRGSDSAADLAVAPQGTTVFVTGFMERSDLGVSDYGTIAYEA
jgi:outer membrane protein assembly factor BamB